MAENESAENSTTQEDTCKFRNTCFLSSTAKRNAACAFSASDVPSMANDDRAVHPDASRRNSLPDQPPQNAYAALRCRDAEGIFCVRLPLGIPAKDRLSYRTLQDGRGITESFDKLAPMPGDGFRVVSGYSNRVRLKLRHAGGERF
jgi:hypothetical protein